MVDSDDSLIDAVTLERIEIRVNLVENIEVGLYGRRHERSMLVRKSVGCGHLHRQEMLVQLESFVLLVVLIH